MFQPISLLILSKFDQQYLYKIQFHDLVLAVTDKKYIIQQYH